MLQLKKKEKTKNKKGKKSIITFFSTILLAIISIGVFYVTYHFTVSKSANSYEASIKKHINDIEAENKKVSTYSKNNTIDSSSIDSIITTLNNNTAKLNALKATLNNEVPTEKYRISHNNLIEGLNNNILVFKQITAMLENENSRDITESLAALESYKSKTLENYKLFSVKNLKISLPKETETFIKNTTNYLTELSIINKELEIQNAQNLEFSEQLDAVIAKFVPLKSDFSLRLQRMRTGSESYDSVISAIDELKDKYSSLKKDFASIAIPTKAKKIYNSFNGILSDYNLYIEELKFAVSNEKTMTNGTALNDATIKSIYSTATDKYLTLDNNYNNFLKAYSDFKTENIK